MIKIGKILVPTDFSEESLKALRYAVEFVKVLMGVEILLMHAVPTPAHPSGVSQLPTGDDAVDACARRLDRIARDEVSDGVAVRTVVRSGPAHVALVDAAKEESVDLIIIATHGRSGSEHPMLGSVAKKLVHLAPCPVLTVRDKQRDFVRG